MLVLGRRTAEKVVIALPHQALQELLNKSGPNSPVVINVQILSIELYRSQCTVKVGIEADPLIAVHRSEIWDRIIDEQALSPVCPPQRRRN